MGRSGPGKCKQQMIAFPFNKLKANRSQVPPSVSYGTCPPTGWFCRLHRTNPTFPPAVLAACSQYTGLLSAPCDRYLHALFSRPCLLADITSASSSLSSRVNHHPLDVEAPPPGHLPPPRTHFPLSYCSSRCCSFAFVCEAFQSVSFQKTLLGEVQHLFAFAYHSGAPN